MRGTIGRTTALIRPTRFVVVPGSAGRRRCIGPDALSKEILAATDEDARASAQGRKVASAACDVKLPVRTACVDGDEDLDRALSGPDLDPDEDLIEPGARPRPAGAPRRPSHHQGH